MTSQRTSAESKPAARELTLTRIFDAPRELVFSAWTDPKQVAHWWGPNGYSNPVCDWNAQPGSAILVHMRGPDGVALPMVGRFEEVVAPERLVFTTTALADQDGNPQLENLNTVTFEEDAGRTKMTLHVVVLKATTAAEAALAGMEMGWGQSLDKLAMYLRLEDKESPAETQVLAEPGGQALICAREFEAPRDLVFKVRTDPDHIPHWWGPRFLTTTVDKLELRPGGAWRFVQRAPDGSEFAFHGVYHEVIPPERLVCTWEFEGMPGHVLLETVTFEDLGSRTRVVSTSIFQSPEDRDGMLYAGAELGAIESGDRLAVLLKELSLGARSG